MNFYFLRDVRISYFITGFGYLLKCLLDLSKYLAKNNERFLIMHVNIHFMRVFFVRYRTSVFMIFNEKMNVSCDEKNKHFNNI